MLVVKAIRDMNKADGDDGVFRLRDLEVQEISLVDRPANQRKFLVVKRDTEDDTMPKGAPITKDGDGNLATNDDKDGDAVQADPAKTTETDEGQDEFGEFGEDVDDSVKSGLSLAPTVKAKLSAALAKIAKRMVALAEAVSGAEEGDGDDMPPALAREIGKIARQLGSLVPGDGAKKDEDGTGDGEVENVAAAVDALHKAGRKISSANLEKLQSAFALIQELMSNLDTPPKGVETEKAESPDEVVALTKAVERLTEIVKRQGATIHKLRGGRPSPASDTDGESVVDAREGGGWPSDFNEDTPDVEDVF